MLDSPRPTGVSSSRQSQRLGETVMAVTLAEAAVLLLIIAAAIVALIILS